MDIGLGCTVWAASERVDHLDGIGSYSGALWRAIMIWLSAAAPTFV